MNWLIRYSVLNCSILCFGPLIRPDFGDNDYGINIWYHMVKKSSKDIGISVQVPYSLDMFRLESMSSVCGNLNWVSKENNNPCNWQSPQVLEPRFRVKFHLLQVDRLHSKMSGNYKVYMSLFSRGLLFNNQHRANIILLMFGHIGRQFTGPAFWNTFY